MHNKRYDRKYSLNDAYIFNPLAESEIKVDLDKFTNMFNVTFNLNNANVTLLNVRELQKYGHNSTSYSSDNLIIKNQIVLSKFNRLFYARELILEAVKHGNKLSKNSLNVNMFKIRNDKFLISIERMFINSVKPYKQSVTFYWIVDVSANNKRTDVRKYEFNNNPQHMLINQSKKKDRYV